MNLVGTITSAAIIFGTISAGGGGMHTIQNQGVDLPKRKNLNFEGDGVIAVDDDPMNASKVQIPDDPFDVDNCMSVQFFS